jgi:uncharacterized protein
MKKIFLGAAASALALAVCLGCATAPKAAAPCEFKAENVAILSRGAKVPAVLTVPAVKGKVPLVVMAHGHGGSKDEAGGFIAIAEALAKAGIASIRMDFPGCGASVEPFTQNTVTNMVADVEAARAYALANAPIDAKRIGMFGYSMGGRIAILSTAKASYKALGLLAPVGTDGADSMYTFMGGADKYAALEAKAKAEGHVVFTTVYGQVQDLSAAWFSDNSAAKGLEAIGAYRGPVLLVHGSVDTTIAESVVKATAAAATKSASVEMVTITGADHGYGFYGGEAHLKADTVAAVSGFFAKNLR